MSVLRQGSSFLQRRLTKLYTDTKSSCESVSTASKPNDDPELVELNQNFRKQKDRLLAWGLDWSDESAAQPNDIDEALGEAGFSDVVAGVMSSIQQVLNEAERLQQPTPARGSDNISKASGGVAAASTPGAVKDSWTEGEVTRSKDLLDQLTGHIDTLYDLSYSRRNMSMSMASSTKSGSHAQARPPLSSKWSKSSKDIFESPVSSHPTKAQLNPSFYPSDGDSKRKGGKYPSLEELGMPHCLNLRVNTEDIPPLETNRQSSMGSFEPTKDFHIDKAALRLSKTGAPHASHPPPYESVAGSASSRAVGQLKREALSPSLAGAFQDPYVSVLVEFSPISLEMQNSLIAPPKERLYELHETLERLADYSRVSHLGLLKFVGYFVDMTYSRYAFLYLLPITFSPLVNQPSDKITPKPLVSLFYAGDDRGEAAIPNLETRLRLAYNIVLAVLHLRSQNVVHGNINSNNLLVFPDLTRSDDSEADLRHPYLASLAQFDGGDKNVSQEPLSSRMYRHPDDHQKISDPSAWAYDLYSLGLVLLEIGLWIPLSRLWKMKYNATTFKSRIENVYVKKLGAKCGGAFLQTVQLCLDAPNFHLSTEPMKDLSLRIPSQTHRYPWQDGSTDNAWNTFSKNFVYTISRIVSLCCQIDVFSPPPPEDLQEHLPPPLSISEDNAHPHESQIHDIPVDEQQYFGVQPTEPAVPINLGHDGASMHEPPQFFREKSGNPEKRVRKRTVKRWSNEEIPEHHLQQWNTCIMPKISKLLQKVLRDSAESCGVNLMIAGETPETVKTTICVTCTSVRKVRAALKKYFDYDRENWDLIVLRGDVKRSKVPRKKRKKQKGKTTNPASSSRPDPNPYYQAKPVCGASIGAFREDEHLPPVSYGGAILVDGIPYGMTVHHMLDSPFEDDGDDSDNDERIFHDKPPRSAANPSTSLQMSEQDFAYSWCESDPPEVDYPFEITDDEEDDERSMAPSLDDSYDDYWLSDGFSSDEAEDLADDDFDDDDCASIGDTAGVFPGEEPEVVVTQPAIDDVDDDFFPCPEDKDDEHLASHLLGYVHASSGIRRWTRDGIKHEVDWALMKIDENRLDANNVVTHSEDGNNPAVPGRQSNQASQSQPHTLSRVARLEDLGGCMVQCCGRTSGLQTGRISKALTLVKMHGRQSFSSSFSVEGNFGVPGDSGAWVFDSAGQVCGHVLAWSEKSRMAYIAPMRILLDDIARTLGASSVILPASPEATLTHPPIQSASHGPMSTGRMSDVPSDPLPFELQKLSLEETNPNQLGDIRGGKGVSGPPYRSVDKMVPQSRAIPRQIA